MPVAVCKDYTLFFEYDKGFCFIHCDCTRWTNTVRKRMLKDLVNIQKQDIYAIHEILDKKHAKFLELFKFKFLKDFVGLDGQCRQLYIRRMSWELKQL
jgi:hypothetical protein